MARLEQLAGGDRGHLDLEIEPVEHTGPETRAAQRWRSCGPRLQPRLG